LTTADLSKSASTSTNTGAGSGTSTGASTGGVTQNAGNTGVTGGGIGSTSTGPNAGTPVQDYAKSSTGTVGGNVVVAFDGFMYSSNGKKLTLNDLIKN
jgi:hypothetical protein